MEGVWKIIAAIIAVAGFSWVIYSASTAYFRIEGRLEKVENQLSLIASAPAIVQTGNGGNPSQSNDVEPYKPIANPLIATCLDLVKRAATARETNASITIYLALEGYIRDYGCQDLMKRLSQQTK
jgi:hypothetical protein